MNWDWEFGTGFPITKESFEEPVSGYVSRPKEGEIPSWREAQLEKERKELYPEEDWLGRAKHAPSPREAGFNYIPMAHMREGERHRQETEEAELLDKFRQGDESEEEIVERANKLWRFYEAKNPQKKS